MGLFSKKQERNEPQSQYGVENDPAYAEIFGTTGIAPDGSLDEEEYEDKLFFDTLDYCVAPEQNFLSSIQRGTMTKDNFFKATRIHLQEYEEDDAVIDRVLTRLEKYIWGYYIIEDLINDDSISDIKILNENNIRIKRYGKRLDSGLRFRDANDYQRFVDIICSRNKIMLSDINAIQKFTDTKSNPNARLRFNLSSSLINSNEKVNVHIRKILKRKRKLMELSKMGMFPEELIPYLIEQAQYSSGIVFTGKGASGKTTLMNAMIEEIPLDKSGCIIQESDELFTDHPDMMVQHVVSSRGESKIQYTLKDLAINGLLTDLDYFIIGEIKGGEAAYFMNAAYTGHQCWTSVHGVNSQEAMNKLVDYIKYETDYPRTEVLHMLRFMKCIIFMRDFKIDEISEIIGYENGELQYKLVYKRNGENINTESDRIATKILVEDLFEPENKTDNSLIAKTSGYTEGVACAAFNFSNEHVDTPTGKSNDRKRKRGKRH